MALRNQPYFPLYVQDFLTDEKLAECSAESTGVYIRLMCILHKSDEYGCILLKQKDKQNSSNIINFANKLVKQMPYSNSVIENSLKELIEEQVLILENDLLYQKRMRKDGMLSDKRAEAGKKGINRKKKKEFAKAKCSANSLANSLANGLANSLANTEYEYEYENEIEYDNEYEDDNDKKEVITLDKIKEIIDYLNIKTNSHYKYSTEKTKNLIKARIKDGFTLEDLKVVIDNKCEEWIGTEFEKFLRPETLFSNKFEGYLNQKKNRRKEKKEKVEVFDYNWLDEEEES